MDYLDFFVPKVIIIKHAIIMSVFTQQVVIQIKITLQYFVLVIVV